MKKNFKSKSKNIKKGFSLLTTALLTISTLTISYADSFNDKITNLQNNEIEIVEVKQSESDIKDIENQKSEMKNSTLVKCTLTDIENHWGKQNISKLVNLGGINGYPDNTFQPEKTISFAEFLKIAVSSKVPVEEIKVVPNSHWVQGVYETAVEKGIITPQEFSADEDTFNAPITREDMALILVRINELNNTKVDTTSVDTLIKDYSNISELRRYYVKQAYKKGLLKGKGGTFDPQGSLKRAEAATAVVNMLEYKPGQEIEVEVKEEIVEGREIDITDPNRPKHIKEGDVIIKADGTKVVLKKGDAGVLGQGQGIDYWSGVRLKNGVIFKEQHGMNGSPSQRADSKGCHWKHGYAGQPYAVDKDVVAQYDYEEAGKQYKKGDLIRQGTGEGHFRDDWGAIKLAEGALAMKLYPTPPKEPTWVGEYTYFDGDSWGWTGPIFN